MMTNSRSPSPENDPDVDLMDQEFLNLHFQDPPKILWSGVLRNNTILAEATDESLDLSSLAHVEQTAKELLARKPTPGFEYHTQNRLSGLISNRFGSKSKKSKKQSQNETSDASHTVDSKRPLKGIKFHVYEHITDNSDNPSDCWSTNKPDLRIWVFGAVYDPSCTDRKEVQSFLDKIAQISEPFRESDAEWQSSDTLGLQYSFAPVLQQRMEETTYLGKVTMLETNLHACQQQMEDNITLILERGKDINELKEEATHMQEMARVFKKKAKKCRRHHLMKNAKYGLVVGSAITGVTAVAVIPPLVAIL